MPTTFEYQYFDEGGGPLRRCPACRFDLTADGGVMVHLAVAGREFDVPSRLDADGRLLDTADRAVSAGFHAGTHCGKCGELVTE